MTDTTHEAPDLLPCPFCGGEAEHYYRSNDSGLSYTDWVCCNGDCGASTCMHETKQESISAWNTRNDTAQAMVAAALREAASVAQNACLVPPDGGSPTEDEENVCRAAADYILALIPDAGAALDRALATERERCAKIVEDQYMVDGIAEILAEDLAAAIRAQGKT